MKNKYCQPCINPLPSVKQLTKSEIFEKGCLFFDLEPCDVTSPYRNRCFVDARQMIMTLLRKRTNMTLKEIGKMFKRDHTTVMFAVTSVTERNEVDLYYRAEFRRLEKFIYN